MYQCHDCTEGEGAPICCICLDPILKEEEEEEIHEGRCRNVFFFFQKKRSRKRSTLPCGHVFHSGCVFQWLSRKMTCPVCRNKIVKKTVRKTERPSPRSYESISRLPSSFSSGTEWKINVLHCIYVSVIVFSVLFFLLSTKDIFLSVCMMSSMEPGWFSLFLEGLALCNYVMIQYVFSAGDAFLFLSRLLPYSSLILALGINATIFFLRRSLLVHRTGEDVLV